MTKSEIAELPNLIGTDVSIEECVSSGYLIVDTENKPFDKDTEYRITEFEPDYLLEEIDKNPETVDRYLFTLSDGYYSFNELMELYLDDKKSIDSFAETHKFIDFDNPTFHDLIHLASDISGYKGLP